MVDVASGRQLLSFLSALASPQRLRVVAALSRGRNHVSGLARELGMSRPLLYLHLQKLEAAGIVGSSLELSGDGKAMKYFELMPFDVRLTVDVVTRAADSLPTTMDSDKEES